MSTLIVFLVLLVAMVAVLLWLGAIAAESGSREQDLEEFRLLNASLVQRHFGPQGPSGEPIWHRTLAIREEGIIWAGCSILLGLRQILLIEDQSGRHWRVVVAHETGSEPTFHVQELGAEIEDVRRRSEEGGGRHASGLVDRQGRPRSSAPFGRR